MKNKTNKTNVRLLLANSPNDLLERGEDWEYSLAHACLAAAVEEAGHTVAALHFIKQDWESIEAELKKKLAEFKPTHFGISILTDCRVNAHKICAIVKDFDPNISVIAGGVHASFMSKQTLDDPNINVVVIGEGEQQLLYILNNPEIAHKKVGKLAIPGTRNFKLDTLPMPKHELYTHIIKEKGIGYMVTGRGCVNHPGCSFCCGQAYWKGCMTQRTAEKVVEEIQYLFKINPELQEIHFLDDEFLCNKQRIYKIFTMLEDINIKFKWICSARVTSMDEEFIKYVKSKGCHNVHFGVESFSQTILNRAHKNVDVKLMCKVIKLCRKHDLHPTLMCITGLPEETSETVNENISIASSIGEAIEPAITLVYPGTEVYSLALQKGQLTEDYWLTECMAPLYTAEHSKLRLMYWAYKTAIVTHYHAGSLSSFLSRKLRLNRIETIFKKFLGGRSR